MHTPWFLIYHMYTYIYMYVYTLYTYVHIYVYIYIIMHAHPNPYFVCRLHLQSSYIHLYPCLESIPCCMQCVMYIYIYIYIEISYICVYLLDMHIGCIFGIEHTHTYIYIKTHLHVYIYIYIHNLYIVTCRTC